MKLEFIYVLSSGFVSSGSGNNCRCFEKGDLIQGITFLESLGDSWEAAIGLLSSRSNNHSYSSEVKKLLWLLPTWWLPPPLSLTHRVCDQIVDVRIYWHFLSSPQSYSQVAWNRQLRTWVWSQISQNLPLKICVT